MLVLLLLFFSFFDGAQRNETSPASALNRKLNLQKEQI